MGTSRVADRQYCWRGLETENQLPWDWRHNCDLAVDRDFEPVWHSSVALRRGTRLRKDEDYDVGIAMAVESPRRYPARVHAETDYSGRTVEAGYFGIECDAVVVGGLDDPT